MYDTEDWPLHGTPCAPDGAPWDSTPPPVGWVPVVGERVVVRHRPTSHLPLGCDWLRDWFGKTLWVASVRYDPAARDHLNVGVHEAWPPHKGYGETDGWAVDDFRPLGADSVLKPQRATLWRHLMAWWGR